MYWCYILVYTYTVEVYTGDQPGSDTDAQVYLEITGDRGDTGCRKLLKSLSDGDKFDSGKVSKSTIANKLNDCSTYIY